VDAEKLESCLEVAEVEAEGDERAEEVQERGGPQILTEQRVLSALFSRPPVPILIHMRL
jgi:hypothetical protein